MTPQTRRGPGSAPTLPEAEKHTHRIADSSALAGYRALAGNSRTDGYTDRRIDVSTSSRPNAEVLLSRLDSVQRSGTGWRARCPACGGTSRKLSIAEADDRILLHCFGCGDAEAVLAAVGLSWADLHPPRHWPQSPDERRRARRALQEAGWAAALGVLAFEACVVAAGAGMVLQGTLTVADTERLRLAVARIQTAREVLR